MARSKRPRQFGEVPELPNFGSKHRTPTTVILDTHYAQLQLLNRWTWDRYARLCQILQLTPHEFGSYVTLRHDAVDRLKERGLLSGAHAEAVALLLTIMEGTVLGEMKSDAIKDPFPKLP